MIRDMEHEDIPVLVELGSAMHQESRYRHLDYDFDKTEKMGHLIVENRQKYFGKVALKDGEYIGMMSAFSMEYFFGHDLLAADLITYIKPEHRGGLLAARLTKMYEKWARDVGCTHVSIATSTGVGTEMMRKFYVRLGFEPWGHSYKKDVRYG